MSYRLELRRGRACRRQSCLGSEKDRVLLVKSATLNGLHNNNPENTSSVSGARACLKMPHSVIVRAPGLLPMLYTLTELGDELEISVRILREWQDRGLPHERDARGHIWIDGRRFAAWVQAMQQARLAKKLKEGQAYCLNCRRPVELKDPTSVSHGKQMLLSGVCPDCGSSIHRGSRNGQSA